MRFIAIDDAVDKDFFDIDTSKDMMIDLKNMFIHGTSAQRYARHFALSSVPDNLLVRLPRMATASPHPIITNC